MTTYWMFCVWVNALENAESLRFHAELPFDPRTLGPEQGGAFVAETMARLGVRPEQVGNLRDTPCMKMEIFDTEAECTKRYTEVRRQLNLSENGRDQGVVVGRYGVG